MRWWAAVGFAVALAGCGGTPDYPPTAEGLYLRHCSRCHEDDGNSKTAARLAKRQLDLRDPALQAELSDAGIIHIIEFGQGRMQGVADLSPAEHDSIVLWVRHLGKPGAP